MSLMKVVVRFAYVLSVSRPHLRDYTVFVVVVL